MAIVCRTHRHFYFDKNLPAACTVVPGALFSLGDVHALQGDGEVVGAPEIAARVTARFSIDRGSDLSGFSSKTPRNGTSPSLRRTKQKRLGRNALSRKMK